MSPPSPSLACKDGGGLQLKQQKSIRPHPPRLQHSPSLPNIRFPPHSGPIPRKLNKMSCDSENLLSDSDSSEKHEALHQGNDSKQLKLKSSLVFLCEQSQTSRPHVKTISQKPPGRRQRVKNEPHKLLTPPLTPSSSIRTTTSVESNVGHCDSFSGDHSAETTGGDEDVASLSRFLRVDNLSPEVPEKLVKNAITSSITTSRLAHYRSDTKLPTPVTPTTKDEKARNIRAGPVLDNPIKGLLLGSGYIFLAFHDLRDAAAAKRYFETRESGPFDSCVDQTEDGTGKQRLTCKFLAIDQVALELGVSPFLKSMDASFEITIVPDVPAEEITNGLKKFTRNEDVDKKCGISTREVALLQSFLETFGELRTFEDMSAQDESQTTTYLERRTFRIEFFDIRETNSAYDALDGMVMFGMKIKVSGREDIDSVKTVDHSDSEVVQAKTAEKNDIVPFPISRAFGDCIQPFGPPGQFSQTRQPFPPSNDDTIRNAPSVSSADHGSPPVFYTSSNHVASDIPVGIGGGPSEGNGLDPQQQFTRNYYHGSAYPTLDGTPNTVPLMQYFVPTPTPPPSVFQHGYVSPPPPPHFSCQSIHPLHGGMIPFEPSLTQPLPWSIETMNGYPLYPPRFPADLNISNSIPNQDPCWLQGVTARTTSYFSPCGPHATALPETTTNPPSSVQEDPPHFESSPPVRLVRNALKNTGKKEISEHNQFNLARIELGVDPRTTVMIKNIPNKMSDKDLMRYIADVCPRRIDFLYLRMDFKNGCNVGYAFVNFISIQDLLLFAKARLGQKWNMFSSEKVLQMSYANYQGKEALVDKFKNSCIMDEREAWQPKIFYSEPGPEQGLPEPFPAATHQRRKERSSHNRGALFVPGNSSLQTHNVLIAPFSPRKLVYNVDRRERERYYRRQRTTTVKE